MLSPSYSDLVASTGPLAENDLRAAERAQLLAYERGMSKPLGAAAQTERFAKLQESYAAVEALSRRAAASPSGREAWVAASARFETELTALNAGLAASNNLVLRPLATRLKPGFQR